VRIPLTEATDGLWYKYVKNDTYETLFFGIKKLDAVGGCKDGVGVAMSRDTTPNQPPYDIENPAPFKQVGIYTYYLAYANGGTCYDETNAAQVAQVNAVTGGKSLKDFTVDALKLLEEVK
jgi:hypothetical protein